MLHKTRQLVFLGEERLLITFLLYGCITAVVRFLLGL